MKFTELSAIAVTLTTSDKWTIDITMMIWIEIAGNQRVTISNTEGYHTGPAIVFTTVSG